MKNKPTTFILLAVLIILLVASGCSLITPEPTPAPQPTLSPAQLMPPPIIAEGNIVPADFTSLAFTTGGTVVQVLVEEGDLVSAGEILARLGEIEPIEASLAALELELLSAQQSLNTLDKKANLVTRQADAQIKTAELALLAAERQLDQLDTIAYRDQLDEARLAIVDLKAELDTAEDEFEEVEDLSVENELRKERAEALDDAQKNHNEAIRSRNELILNLESAKAQVNLAEAALADARLEFERVADGPDQDTVALLEARIATAEAQRKALDVQASNLVLTAPFAGTIVKVNIAVNDKAAPGQPVFTLADYTNWYVETTDLTEIEVVNIRLGGGTDIEPDAFPGETVRGVVESISDIGELRRGDMTYTTRIKLEDTSLAIRWGMTVMVRFDR